MGPLDTIAYGLAARLMRLVSIPSDPGGTFLHRPPAMPLVDREEFILERCEGKDVLHVGCVDWPILDQRLASGEWLHAKVKAASRSVIGLDNNEDGVLALNARGYEEILLGSAETPGDALGDRSFDLVVAGEVVEHLLNPGMFLTGLRPHLRPGGLVLITVPNGLHYRNFGFTARGVEFVHEDHTAWFSHTTLRTLLRKAGYETVEATGYVSRADRTMPRLARHSTHFANGLAFTARPVA